MNQNGLFEIARRTEATFPVGLCIGDIVIRGGVQ